MGVELGQLAEAEAQALWLEEIWHLTIWAEVIKDSKSDVSAWPALQELLRRLRTRGPLLSYTLDDREHERSLIGRSALEAPVSRLGGKCGKPHHPHKDTD